MVSSTQRPSAELAALAPALIIFDKGGTLIDFHGMWSGWVTELARRLEDVTDFPVTDRLFHAMGFDPDSGQIAPDGRLATTPNCTYRLDMLAFIGWQREREHK